MPLPWTITIYTSTLAFLVTSFVVRHRAAWLSGYLLACVPAGVMWANQHWIVSRWMRPFLLALQLMAVIEAIGLMHQKCWNPRRRYLCAGFCGLLAIGDTFWALEYPGYPKALWWVQLWIEAGSAAACVASLALFRWWKDFRPAGWTIGNVVIMGFYCWVEIVAMLWRVDARTWVSVDISLALIQDWCLMAWIVLYTRDL